MGRRRIRDILWFDNETLRTLGWLVVFLVAILVMGGLAVVSVALVIYAFANGEWWFGLIAPFTLYGSLLLSKLMPYIAIRVVGLA